MQLRDLPSVDAMAERLVDSGLPRPVLVDVAQSAVDAARYALLADPDAAVDPIASARAEIETIVGAKPRSLINATGVLLHTNLGRAPLSLEAAASARDIAAGYGNVELDVSSGARGGRGAYVSQLLRTLTGAEAGFAVGNNAGALLLSLAALAGGRNVVVSRGELIEIGGSFRLPELMRASGARLLEVGTTNRTRLADYAAVIGDAAMILKIHPSNYRIDGFTEEASYRELAELASAHGLPFVADVGSGLLDSRTPWLQGPPPSWTTTEPAVRQTLEAGADVVLFSGDKLLGGPQAGIAVGRSDHITTLKKHPIARGVRLDGPTMAALATTLEHYAGGDGLAVPFWRMATATYEQLLERADALAEGIDLDSTIVAGESVPGAGSVPGETIPSPLIVITGDVDSRWRALLDARVLTRRRDDAVLIDLRTVFPDQDAAVVKAINSLVA